jgi:hypothetical protein
MNINPTLPAGPDLVWSAIVLVVAALLVTALVSLWRERKTLSSPLLFAWVMIVLFVPTIGALVWLLVVLPAHRRELRIQR